jgi:hypothetical protein
MLAEVGLDETAWNRAGFGYKKMLVGSPPNGVQVSLMLPHWLVFLLAIPSALRWLWRKSQEAGAASRSASGVMSWCPSCWREIAGMVERCPDCGGPVAVGQQPGAPMIGQ